MKKLLIAAIGLLCAAAIVVQAQDAKPKKELTPEQQTVMNEMLAKYDANKNGKLDKSEHAAMTQEDKDKMHQAGFGKHKKVEHEHANHACTNAPAATDK